MTPAGTATSQPITSASPAAEVERLRRERRREAGDDAARLDASSRARSCCARVNSARKRSPSRTSGGSPGSSIRSCVVRIDGATRCRTAPRPAVATASMRKLVSESLSGTVDARLAALVERDARLPRAAACRTARASAAGRRRRRAAPPSGRSGACRSPPSAPSRCARRSRAGPSWRRGGPSSGWAPARAGPRRPRRRRPRCPRGGGPPSGVRTAMVAAACSRTR